MVRLSPVSSARNSTEISSPPRDTSRSTNDKPKKPPPITPRRFTKFFTPRPSHKESNKVKTSRRALQDITRSGLNRRKRPEPPVFGNALPSIIESPSNAPLRTNKRKLSFSSAVCSPRSSPVPRIHVTPSSSQESYANGNRRPSSHVIFDGEGDVESDEDQWEDPIPVRHTRKIAGASTSILTARLGGGKSQATFCQISDWPEETANFCTGPMTSHRCLSSDAQHFVLPFCVASCSDNSLIAIGDEEGGIRLLDSSPKVEDGFARTYLSMKPHDNAVMDLAFSSDHRLLASASGDQTARIIDMFSQQEVHRLAGHTSSIKRVQFQPSSNDNVIATCSRDGSIKLWDLRCSGSNHAMLDLQPSVSLDGQPTSNSDRAVYVPMINAIRDAHAGKFPFLRKPTVTTTAQRRKETYTRRDDVSVTTIAFLDSGRDHLITSASEANACIKLWDTRMSYSSRSVNPLPVSTTLPPTSHESHRQFGVTSMSFSRDFSRLYTVCRDHTVYAYSTSHLVLGANAPELLSHPSTYHTAALSSSRSRTSNGANATGLGPLYGYRHPRLQVGSFYVRLSVRSPSPNNPNTPLLAVGSSDNCPILVPTSESYLSSLPKSHCSDPAPSSSHYRLRNPSSRTASSSVSDVDPGRDTPIYVLGTPLVEGHSKEVTGVTWTSEGSLVSIGDDFGARLWREDAKEAREVRQSGGRGGRRWMSGWADMGETWDGDESEG